MNDNTPRPEDWQFEHDGHLYPFVEDENYNITGLGHQDKAAFCAEVHRYDLTMGGVDAEDIPWAPEDFSHLWAVPTTADDGDTTLLAVVNGEQVTESTPDAVAVTTLWGAR